MFFQNYDSYIVYERPGGCLNKFIIYLRKGVIVHCILDGGCKDNLQLLSQELKGYKLGGLEDLPEICYGWNKSCVHALRKTLKSCLEKAGEND